MFKLLIVACLLLISSFSVSQDRDFFRFYSSTCQLLDEKNYDEVSSLYDSLIILEDDFNENELLWFSLIHAKVLQKTSSKKEAGELLFGNLHQVELSGDTLLILRYYILLGDILNENGKEYLFKAEGLCPESDVETQSEIFYHLAQSHCRGPDQTSECVRFSMKAIAILKKLRNKKKLAKVYNNLGAYFFSKLDSFYINNNDTIYIRSKKCEVSAKMFLDSSLDVRSEIGGSFLGSGMINKASLWREKDPAKYRNELLKVLAIHDDSLEYEVLEIIYFNLADAYELNGQYKESVKCLNQSIEMAEKRKAEFTERDMLKSMASYESAIMKERMSRLKEESITKRSEANFFKWLSFFAVLAFGLRSYTLHKVFKLKKENYELDLIQSKLQGERRIHELNNTKQREILNASLEAREEERNSISEVLHNSVSAMLSSASLHLTVLKSKMDIRDSAEYNKTQQILGEASDQIRDLSHQLVSPSLQKFGLKFSLTDLCEKYSNEKIEFASDLIELDPRPSHKMEAKIYRIVEELFNNIMKHSKASKAKVITKIEDKWFYVIVMDNGIGMKIKLDFESESIGISQIKLMLDYLDGEFNIGINEGTKITMKFPVEKLYQQSK